MKNGIYLVATPIGNISDISLRALEVLKSADIIACEDTRVSKKLFSLLGLSTKDKTFLAMHDHNEAETADKLINIANQGHIIAYISDAGSPLISDPGFKLAQKCREQNTFITTIPGACAAICALQLSGLPSNNFMFAGFIPTKDKARHTFLNDLKDINTTLIFYETANRLTKTLLTMADIFDTRQIAVAREITKLFEECQNGTAQQLYQHFSNNPAKGEIVLVVDPPTKPKQIDYIPLLKQELAKFPLKTAVKNIVGQYKLNKNEVYQAALGLKK